MRQLLIAALLALSACDAVVGPRVGDPAPGSVQALAPANLPAFFDCLRTESQTVVAAHRGGYAPGFAENSIETFENTLSQAPALLEIDVSETRDGVLVLMHDDTVDRTTNGTGAVDQMTLAQFQALQLEDETGAVLNAHPPTLRQALDWANEKTVLEVDVKRGVSYEDVIAEVREANAMNRVVFITYSGAAATRVHGLAPEMMLSVSVEDANDLATFESHGLDLTRILAWTGTDEPNAALNIALAQRGVEVIFGTLGGGGSWDARFEREGREQYAAFADTGITLISTRRPAAAARDLDQHDDEEGVGALQCLAAP